VENRVALFASFNYLGIVEGPSVAGNSSSLWIKQSLVQFNNGSVRFDCSSGELALVGFFPERLSCQLRRPLDTVV